ncbi:ComEA family DNA-binding protein [Actinoallomurus iriomotensis]|uniref:ComEA family DNA-binding protein n=1 Tax=Actinoallomurus iriomotensis TaxID=478107 RepID=UPI002553C9EC|nr:helix-hairpin-helix domain-containing protein [Actinoallomurus iriomotensis]
MGRRTRTAVSVIWALVPLITAGIATTLVFVFPAIRLRKAIHWLVVAGYLALTVTGFATASSPDSSAGRNVFATAIVVLWLGGTAHAFAIRSRVFATQPPLAPGYEGAVRMATGRRELRTAARESARDPVMAWELRIGRPDLPRGFDDGGLVDVNHVPPYVLAQLPGMNAELVDRILRTREQCGGFTSVEELSALAELPPTLTETLGEYVIFLP